VLRGIGAYARQHGLAWNFYLVGTGGTALDEIGRMVPDGFVGHLWSERRILPVRQLGIPAVDTSQGMAADGYPQVTLDNIAVGRMAGEHLIERGLDAFGFFHEMPTPMAELRRQGFGAIVEEAGYQAHHFYMLPLDRVADPQAVQPYDAQLVEWLMSLPKPLGVMGSKDESAIRVIQAAHEAGLRVPEDVAVVGVHNDDMICSLANPPLSSVRTPGERVGFEAAAQLAALLDGQPAPPEPKTIAPLEVVARRSSEFIAVDDADVRAALEFMDQHAGDPVEISDLLRRVPVHRRTLERKFRILLGRTPAEELRRCRLQRAKRLLADTDLPMPAIAERCGFAGATRLGEAFRRVFGQTPTGYRARFRLRDLPA
jgi:LacI family transcriptional regulator